MTDFIEETVNKCLRQAGRSRRLQGKYEDFISQIIQEALANYLE